MSNEPPAGTPLSADELAWVATHNAKPERTPTPEPAAEAALAPLKAAVRAAEARRDSNIRTSVYAEARAKVQHHLDQLAGWAKQASERGDADKARGLMIARRAAEGYFLGDGGCVIGAFDVRRVEQPADHADARASAQQPESATPAVGDRYASRTDPTRTVTVTRVWDLGDGYGPAVAFEWRDDKPNQCGSACPVDVFHRAYEPVVAPTEPADPWQTVARLTAWLDDRNGRSGTETALRILKVTEEAGEVASAWIGMTGQNPRKGVTHVTADVADELCDVITAAMVALTTISGDPAAHFTRKIAQIAALRLDDTAGGEQ